MQNMASNVLKCSSCNMVISELLAFVHNKISVMDEESIIRICDTAFTPDEILEAKKLLFEAVPGEKLKRRKKDEISRKDLQDIIDCLKKIDALDPERIPIFVAKELHKLPPVTFDHLDATRILRDIVKLQDHMLLMQDEMVAQRKEFVTREYLERFFQPVSGASSPPTGTSNSRKNINTVRGAGRRLLESFECDSGPMDLQQTVLTDNFLNEAAVDVELNDIVTVDNSVDSYREILGAKSKNESAKSGEANDRRANGASYNVSHSHSQENGGASKSADIPPVHAQAHMRSSLSRRVEASTAVSTKCMRPTAVLNTAGRSELQVNKCLSPNKSSCLNDHVFKQSMANVLKTKKVETRPVEIKDDDWQKVTYKKQTRNRFISNQGKAVGVMNSNFKAAATKKIPLFISNVSKETTERDIVEYIRCKTQTDVTLTKIISRLKRDYDSYFFSVDSCKVALFLNDEIWPEGICFRKYVVFKKRENVATNNGV